MGFLTILPALLGAIGPVLSKVLPDEGKRMEVQPDLQKAPIDSQGDLNKAMADVMKADAISESPPATRAPSSSIGRSL